MKRQIFIYLLLIISIAGSSSGQTLNNSSDETFLQSASANVFLNESVAGYAPNLKFIWSVTGIEKGPVIMVLNQDGGDLYGQVKYEPDGGQAWNGPVIGSVQEDRIHLVMTTFRNTGQFSSLLKGTYDAASGLIRGSILQVSKGKVSLKSDFEATPINPDISSYTPARELPRSEASSPVQINATMPEAKESLISASSTSLSTSSSQRSRYRDVREDADRILTGVGDISQIPIGMSGL